MAKYKIGDLAELKSGGPVMTVQYITPSSTGEDHPGCQWFSGKKLESGIFSTSSLKPAEDKSK